MAPHNVRPLPAVDAGNGLKYAGEGAVPEPDAGRRKL